MDYLILGPLEVRDGDRTVSLGGAKQRALLAILVLHRNEVVSTERLIDELWGESPPTTASRTLHAYLSRLRKALNGNGALDAAAGDAVLTAADRALVTQGHGYMLRLAPGELDVERFQRLVDRGRDALSAAQPEQAARLFREALCLWRGAPLADFTYEPFAQGAIAQLEELRIAALEERIEADLALGHDHELVGELRDLVARHPLRERLRAQLMLLLYRSGRQAEALEVYEQFRLALSEQLGLDPGPVLQQLQLGILRRDPTLAPPLMPALAPAGPGEPEGVANASPTAERDVSVRRRRRLVAIGAATLLIIGLTASAISSSGGGAARRVIPGYAVGAIDPATGKVTAIARLGTSPSAVAAGDGSVWVASYNEGTVSRLNPTLRAVVQTIPIGSIPTGIAVGAGAVWVTSYSNTLSRIDPTVNRVVQTIPVGNAPTGVAVGDGSVWVANSSDGTLTRINPESGKVLTTITLGAGATSVAVGSGAVWVSDEAGDRVFRVDPRSDQVTASINVGTGPTAMAGGFRSVWVTNSLDGTVSRIDPTTNTVVATIQVGNGAGAIAVSGHAVWVANEYSGTVSRIETATDTVSRRITVGSLPQGVALAAGLIWVSAKPGTTRHRGGTLNTLSLGAVDTVDPVLRSWGASNLAYDGLTAYRRDGSSGPVQLVPDLAESLPSPTDGGTTYTFQLRRGIRFSNGELVRPEDFRRALERDLIVGPSPAYGDPFADVIGGAACAAHPSHCDLSRGVVTNDTANTVTFHLVAPDPEFLPRLSLLDAVAVPADTALHDVGMHPIPAAGPYMYASFTPHYVLMVRNPYFHEWSHAAQPDGYPDRIAFRSVANQAAAVDAVERGTADYFWNGVPHSELDQLQTRFPSRLYQEPFIGLDALILNTRTRPFNDIRVRRAINYAIDRSEIANLLGQAARPTCQVLPPYLPGYQPYCPYTLNPDRTGAWHAPNLAKAERLVAASHTLGTPITIWNLGAYQADFSPIEPYLVTLLRHLGYPTRIRDLSTDNNATSIFADTRTGAQAALGELDPTYPSAAQIIQTNFACSRFVPDSRGNANLSEFCDRRLDIQIDRALAAESQNAPDTARLWAQADQTVTNQAPVVPLTNPSIVDLISARAGNYQYSWGQDILVDQLWVR